MLNLDSFNALIFGAMDGSTPEKKIELLTLEVEAARSLITEKCCDLLDELEEAEYDSKLFSQIKTIVDNTNHLIRQIKKLEGEKNEGKT